MVDFALLNSIEKRCKETHPNVNGPFGGLFIYLFGEYCQLSQVLDSAIQSETRRTDAVKHGMNVFNSFQRGIKLTESHRQGGPDEQNFRLMLERVSIEDFELLITQ